MGTDQGDTYVSTNDGATLANLGKAGEFGPGTRVYPAASAIPAGNPYIYAAGDGMGDGGKSGVFRRQLMDGVQWEQISDFPGLNGLRTGGEGTLYASSSLAGAGVYRCHNPAEAGNKPTWDILVPPEVNGYASNYSVSSLQVLPAKGTNYVYAAITGAEPGSYGYADRLLVFQDTFTGAPLPVAPPPVPAPGPTTTSPPTSTTSVPPTTTTIPPTTTTTRVPNTTAVPATTRTALRPVTTTVPPSTTAALPKSGSTVRPPNRRAAPHFNFYSSTTI